MKLIAGLLKPSRGELKVFGGDPFRDPSVRKRVAYCPEHEKSYDRLSALEFVTLMAKLSGVPNAKHAAAAALERVDLSDVMHRKVGGFSKGMRQRTKLASCLVHAPELIILDEPLTGVDPVARMQIVNIIQEMAREGTCVVISSHVLYEIEALTEDILVIYRGQILAEGNLFEIRELIDKHPHQIRIECDDPRSFAKHMVSAAHIRSMHFDAKGILLETADPDQCYDQIADAALASGVHLRNVSSSDNNLSSVFDYLTGGKG